MGKRTGKQSAKTNRVTLPQPEMSTGNIVSAERFF